MKKTFFKLLLIFIIVIGCSDNKVTKKEAVNYVDLVYPHLDSENSRWFFFSSACRPFGMVNLSPDTEVGGAWGSGYRYNTKNIKGFSHVHAWQMSGPSVMPVIVIDTVNVFNDYTSDFSHETEIVKPGYHKVYLDRYDTKVELTSTKRVGFHRYLFPNNEKAALLFNLEGQLGPTKMVNATINKIDGFTLSGKVTNAPTHRRPKPIDVFFYVKFDQEITSINQTGGKFLIKVKSLNPKVKMKLAISYTSIENAKKNMESELQHWDFDKVVEASFTEWNNMLGRIHVEGNTKQQQRRFYTDLWHALQGRRIISDVNGAYPDNTSSTFKIGQIPLDKDNKPKFNHYNSDSFWGAQWTITTLWQLAYPEIAEEFVNSLLQYYKDGGLVPRGPSGGNYTYVMTGASATPFMVAAYQKGIWDHDPNLLYQALKKNHISQGIMARSGYEHKTNLGGGLDDYISKGYVPYPNPNGHFGGHQDGGSTTLEYAYQDYALAQLSKVLGEQEDYNYFVKRASNYKHVFDINVGWIRPKDSNGKWKSDYDPYQYRKGFVEANGAQATWFVPHDLKGLATLMGGNEKAVNKLEQQFKQAEKLGFTSGTSHAVEDHPEYRRIPINYGNQPSMQTAHVFHYLDRPDLTQYWTHKVVKSVYSSLDTNAGYNGDEDQGLMGSLAVLMKIGLFQMTGGVEQHPSYIVTAPIFNKVSIKLNPKYYSGKQLDIEVKGEQVESYKISNLHLNNEPITNFEIKHQDIIKGGTINITTEN